MAATATASNPAIEFFEGLDLPRMKIRGTRKGQLQFRSIPVPDGFWKLWKTHKPEIYELGWSVRKDGDQWILQQWLDLQGNVGSYAKQKAREARELSREESSYDPDWTPDLALPDKYESKLLPWQPRPARIHYHALRTHNASLDASDMGSGKTYQALAGALAVGMPVAVICPKSVIPSWKSAFRHFGAMPMWIWNWEALRTGSRKFRHIITRDSNREFQWAQGQQDYTLIFDEAHNAKNGGTLNSGLVLAAARQSIPSILLSATLADSPAQMHAAGFILGLHDGTEKDFRAFMYRYGCAFDYEKGKFWEVSPESLK